MTSKKGRGRPPGTGKDDTPMLVQIADSMTANLNLKPTTAIRRINPRAGDAEVRRLQVKWKLEGARYLAQARARYDEAAEQACRAQLQAAQARLNHQMEAAAAVFRDHKVGSILGGIESARMQALRDGLGGAMESALRELVDSGALASLGTINGSPAVRAIIEAQSPRAELLRQLEQIGSAGKAAQEAMKAAGNWSFGGMATRLR